MVKLNQLIVIINHDQLYLTSYNGYDISIVEWLTDRLTTRGAPVLVVDPPSEVTMVRCPCYIGSLTGITE